MRIVDCLLILGLTASIANAQSLAELARKEKERRESNDATTGVVEVYSDDDLDDDDPDNAEPPAEAESEDDTSLDDWLDDKEAARADWRERLAGYQERYTEQKERLARLAQIKTECDRDAAPVPTTEFYVASGSYVTWGVGNVACEALPEMVSECERTMRAIEVECREDARRHFMPPAEAKLH
jgi:hypothetical protein